MTNAKQSPKERLLAKAIREGGCLVWQGHTNRSGYGSTWYAGKNRDAHRVSYELHHGPIPDGKIVMHTCDNRRCIEPAHLKLGTHSDNMHDMFAKGRGRVRSGEQHHYAKLNPEIAAEIRRRFIPYDRKNGSSALAREFNVSQSAVHTLLRGETWKV